MNEEQMREGCLEMIEDIFEEGEDVDWPSPADHDVVPVQILGSEDEYVLATEKYGKKEYEDADEVLDALVAVEEAYGTEEALRFTYENLKAVS